MRIHLNEAVLLHLADHGSDARRTLEENAGLALLPQSVTRSFAIWMIHRIQWRRSTSVALGRRWHCCGEEMFGGIFPEDDTDTHTSS